MHASIDISTLNIAAIKQLKTYTLPPTYHLGSYGSGCAGDAPGFPPYRLQPVYSKGGGTPRTAPEALLNIEGVNYVLRRWEPRIDVIDVRVDRHPDADFLANWVDLARAAFANRCRADLTDVGGRGRSVSSNAHRGQF